VDQVHELKTAARVGPPWTLGYANGAPHRSRARSALQCTRRRRGFPGTSPKALADGTVLEYGQRRRTAAAATSLSRTAGLEPN
jgi:hypothetical protein